MMKRFYSIVMLMSLWAGIAAAQERTPMPEIYIQEGENAWVIGATGEGVIHFYKDLTEVENPYTVELTDEEQYFVFGAYAKSEGCFPSEWVEWEVIVPALGQDPPIFPEPQFGVNVNLTDEYAILEPYCSDERYTLYLIVDGIEADIPCMLLRGRADYLINAVVVAISEEEGYEYGSNTRDIIIPATEHFVPDVDGDGAASIADVTVLIDHILNPREVPVEWLKADCDGDGYINIGDVVALIDYLLTGTW